LARRGGPRRNGCGRWRRPRLGWILEQHLYHALGARDHDTIVGDLLDLAAAHRIAN
jgi:hypothetical protein